MVLGGQPGTHGRIEALPGDLSQGPPMDSQSFGVIRVEGWRDLP